MSDLLLRSKGDSYPLSIENDGEHFRLTRGEDTVAEGRYTMRADGCTVITVGTASTPVWVAVAGKSLHVAAEGRSFVFDLVDEEAERLRSRKTAGPSAEDLCITPPMPGKVIKLLVAEGDEVRKNQGLVILEAMKMENEIKAALPARVKSISCTVGDLKEPGETLIELEPLEA